MNIMRSWRPEKASTKVPPKGYIRPALDKHRLGEFIDLIGTIILVSPRELFEDDSDLPTSL